MAKNKNTPKAQTEEKPELKVIKLGEKFYDANQLSKIGVNILNDLNKVDTQLAQQKLSVSITDLAKGTLMEKLEAEIPNFTEIDPPDEIKAQFAEPQKQEKAPAK